MRPLLVMLMLLPAAAGATAARATDGEWWVVVGAIASPDYTVSVPLEADSAALAARRCGMEPYSDFSGKFAGFAPGYSVTVVGDFATKRQAEAALAQLRPCVPGAYVRHGAYAGD